MEFSIVLESFISKLNEFVEITEENDPFKKLIRNTATEVFEPLFGQAPLSNTSFSDALESFISKILVRTKIPSNRKDLSNLNKILDSIHVTAKAVFEPFCQQLNSLTNLVRLFLRSKDMIIYQKIMELFRSDPEINPNWGIVVHFNNMVSGQFIEITRNHYTDITYLVDIINSYGCFADFIYILERPGIAFDEITSIIKFTDNLTTDQIEQLITIFKSIGVTQTQLTAEHRNYFGFGIATDNIFFTDFSSKHLHLPETINALGPKCPCCDIKTNKNHLRFKGPANCHCRLHWDCALNLAVSFINQITNPNPLERKIISCPGCQGQIRPSFLLEIKNLFSSLKTILEYRNYLPNNFIFQYEKELLILINLDLTDLNNRILIMNFQNHPNFAPCPKEKCHGFALTNPDIETSTRCLICHETSLFVGKNRQLELAKESSEVKELLGSTRKIRPCPHCGKLIEKNGGCENMRCAFCDSIFIWMRKPPKVNSELVVHF